MVECQTSDLMVTGSNPGWNYYFFFDSGGAVIDPRSQGVIPRRFKRKKNFVTNGRTEEQKNGRTDGRTDVSVEIVI